MAALSSGGIPCHSRSRYTYRRPAGCQPQLRGDQRQEDPARDRLSQHRQCDRRHGVINDTAKVDALRKLIPAANNQITVSPLQQVDGKPVVTILVPRGADSAYLYYLDMSEFKSLLEKMSGEGRYFSLAEGQGNELYSSKSQGES